MADAVGIVVNSFGIRSLVADVSKGQDAAKTSANATIDAVDDVLSKLEGAGDDSLSEALSAISELGQFKPGSIQFNYIVPDYIPLTAEAAEMLDVSMLDEKGDDAPEDPITGSVSIDDWENPEQPEFEPLKPPVQPASEIKPPDEPPKVTEPVEVVIGDIEVPVAPKEELVSEPTLEKLAEPVLKTLEVPRATITNLPTYERQLIGSAPEAPEFKPLLDMASFKYADKRAFRAAEKLPEWVELIKELPQYFRSKISAREVFSARTTWQSRGYALDDETLYAQTSYAASMVTLMNAGEKRREKIDTALTNRALMFAEIDARVKEIRSDFEIDELGVQKAELQAATLYAGTYLDLFKALAAIYNARVTEFGVEASLYKLSVEKEMAKLDKWRMEVEAEISKSKINTQLAQVYAARTQVQINKVSLYEATVQALMTKVQSYKTRMEAFSASAEAARVRLTSYKGKVEAHIGKLEGYKAKFSAFEAKIKGKIGENQSKESDIKASIAEMQAAAAPYSVDELKIQLQAADLKKQAKTEEAGYEPIRIANTLAAVYAQVNADMKQLNSKDKVMEWLRDLNYNAAKNESVVAEMRAASRYYNAASDSAYRASEQAFRAMLSSAQAANIAQESAGRSAASVAQGAYSAMHVNASLQGSGRVSAEESEDARNSRMISDYLDYSESRNQVLSA